MTDDDGIPFGELPVLMQAAGIALTRDNRLDPSDQNTAHPLAHAEGGAAVLAFSLMVDSVERFDTLLMEIRHLQMNLIYFMRAPELHAALRYEESYIFGSCAVPDNRTPDQSRPKQTDWSDLFSPLPGTERRPVQLDQLGRLAEAFVPSLPVPHDEYGFDMLDGDLQGRKGDRAFGDLYDIVALRDHWRLVIAPIVRALRRRRMSGQADDSFENSYQVLSTLQSLKRNIVYDKLHVAWYGARAFLNPDLEPAPFNSDGAASQLSDTARRRADMMLVRAIAVRNMTEHLLVLSDLHAHFEKTLDIGSQENHRPITGRRREQGMYHHMLGERSRDLYIEASRVVQNLLGKDASGDVFRGLPSFIHRWSHMVTSKNRSVPALTRNRRVAEYALHESRRGTEAFMREARSYSAFAVNTSFFMPDRPDLQPVIAHEAVHCVLLELFDEMNKPVSRLASDSSDLSRFWALLLEAGRFYRSQMKAGNAASDKVEQELVREMLVDTLAAAITGPEFLFAEFQEMCGVEFHKLVQKDDLRHWDDIALFRRRIDDDVTPQKFDMTMHLRLVLACDVAESLLASGERHTLVFGMIAGIRQCLDDLLKRVAIINSDDLTAPTADMPLTDAEMLERSPFYRGVKRIEERFREALLSSGICTMLSAIRENAMDDDHRGHEQPPRKAGLPFSIQIKCLEFYIEKKLSNLQRPLHKAMAHMEDNGDNCTITSADPSFSARMGDTAEAEKRRKAAGQDIKVAARAIEAFSRLYVFGKGKRDRRAVAGIKEIRRKLVEPGSGLALQDMLDEVPCFMRLSDIAWQSSLFRSIEMGAQIRGDNKTPFTTMSHDFAPGRETLQFATEFWGYDRRMTVNALAEASRLMLNLLQLPIGETSQWKPRPSDSPNSGSDMTLLHQMIATILPGDVDEVRTRLQALSTAIENKVECHAQKEHLMKALGQIDEDGQLQDAGALRETATCKAEELLKSWLGTSLDADFFELDALGDMQSSWRAGDKEEDEENPPKPAKIASRRKVEKRHAEYLKAQFHAGNKADNLCILMQAFEQACKDNKQRDDALQETLQSVSDQISQAIQTSDSSDEERIDTVIQMLVAHPEFVVHADFKIQVAYVSHEEPQRSEVRRLSQSLMARRLIDDCIRGLRVFELSWLAHVSSHLKGEKAHNFASRLGALQVLKLEQGYPHIVFPMRLPHKPLWPLEDLRALQTDFAGADLSLERCRPLERFLNHDEVRKAPAHARALIATTIHRLLKERMRGIATDCPDALEKGLTQFDQARNEPVDQLGSRPIAPRMNGDIVFTRNVIALCRGKLKRLANGIDHEGLHVQELAPLQTLLRHVSYDEEAFEESPVVKDALNALSQRPKDLTAPPPDGLDSLGSVFIARQSLVDTHWWREIDSPDTGDGQVDKHEEEWKFERLHASFYHETPHNGAHQEGNGLTAVSSGIRRFATLGRYDFFSFTSDAAFAQQRLPVLDRSVGHRASTIFADPDAPYSKLLQERVYRGFFMRGEFALAMGLCDAPMRVTTPTLSAPSDTSRKDRDLLAILSVRLDRRSSRLGFIRRLRKAARDWTEFTDASGEKCEPEFAHEAQVMAELRDRDPMERNVYASEDFHRTVLAALEKSVRTRMPHDNAKDDEKNSECQQDSDANDGNKEVAEDTKEEKENSNNNDSNKKDDKKETDVIIKEMFDALNNDPAAFKDDLSDLCKATTEDRAIHDAGERAHASRLGFALDAARYAGDLPDLSLEACGPFLGNGDKAFLGEGWGDVYLLMFCDRRPTERPGEGNAEFQSWLSQGVRRLYDVFALQHALFQDHEVYRTETFLRPVALPFAAADDNRMHASMAVRSREDRELDSMVHRMLHTARKSIERQIPLKKNEGPADYAKRVRELVTIAHVPGRNDLEITLHKLDRIRSGKKDDNLALSLRYPSRALEFIHEIGGAGEQEGGGGSEEVATRISFRHSVTTDPSRRDKKPGCTDKD